VIKLFYTRRRYVRYKPCVQCESASGGCFWVLLLL